MFKDIPQYVDNLKMIIEPIFKVYRLVFSKLLLILLIGICPAFLSFSYAQEPSITEIEDEIKNRFGLDKLKELNRLTAHYYEKEGRKALRYGRQAVALGENIFVASNTNVDPNQQPQLILAYLQLGKVLYAKEDYFSSQRNLESAKSLSLLIKNNSYTDEIEEYLEEIQKLIESGEAKENLFSRTIGTLKVGETINEATQDIAIQSEIRLGELKEKSGNFPGAIDHYKKAVNLLRNKGDVDRLNELQLRIAVLLDGLNEHEEAQKHLNEAISEMESGVLSSIVIPEIDSLWISSGNNRLQVDENQESLRLEQKDLKELSESYALGRDFEKSLAYYKLYQELSRKMETDSLNAEVQRKQREGEILLLRQQKKIADLNVTVIEKEKEKQVRLRNTSVLIGLLILFATLVTLYFYFSKKREHKKLTITHRDLIKTKGKLEVAEQKIVNLLSQQLSVDVARELISSGSDKPVERRFVCIMFLDIRDFTPMAEKLSPEELITFQNNTFGFMIDVVQRYHGNMNQLLGDGFMATFGAPVSHANDCQNAYLAAKEILAELQERIEAGLLRKIKIGIGLHAGFVVTGNVGNESRKQYSVTGNTVIIASRIEQLNKQYKSQLIFTEEVFNKLDSPPEHTNGFLEVNVKGRTKPVRILTFN